MTAEIQVTRALFDEVMVPNYAPAKLIPVKGQGARVWDQEGREYIDFAGGIAVNALGHAHPVAVKALVEQGQKLWHIGNGYTNEPVLNLAKQLVESTFADKVFFCNSGAEANEAALKLAKRVTGRTQLIAFKGSYHGNTHGSLSVSANEIKKTPFRPLLPDVDFIRLNELEDLKRITERTAGVILETVQGDAGVRKASAEFLTALRKRCDEVGALLIFDEIQCGMGRTGKMFAFEHSGVVPDVLTLGKALGGGLPIGAFISKYAYMNQLSHSPMLGHITTFGGNPVINAAAWGTLEVFESEIDFNEVERLGALLESYLQEIDEIFEIRREGMMFACDMASDERVAKVVEKLLEYGVISFWFLSHPYSFRLSPPLNITEEQVHEVGKWIRQAVWETK